MRNKVLLSALVIILILVLAGCGVVPPINQSPTASFTATPTSGIAPLEVSFNASSSYDPDGNIVSYVWDFKDGNTGNGEIVSHTFSSAGSYNVKLTVTDDKGTTGLDTKTIIVTTPELTPETIFPSREEAMEIIEANAYDYWGDDYIMVQWEIDLQTEAYDWLVQQTEYPNIMSNAYDYWGDDYSMVKWEYERQVEAYEGLLTTPPITTNQSPIASFTAYPTSGVAPLGVSFNASNSSDSDGSIISYAWDFKDGNTGNGLTINHTFSYTGSYNVLLTITDNKGATDSTTKTITVTDPIIEPVPLGTPLTKDGITVTVEKIDQVEWPLCPEDLFGVEIYFSVINNSEKVLRGPGRFDYFLDEEIYEDEFNSIGYNHIGDGISWIYPRQSRSVGYRKCFHSLVTIKQITWGASFEDYSEIELGPWEN